MESRDKVAKAWKACALNNIKLARKSMKEDPLPSMDYRYSDGFLNHMKDMYDIWSKRLSEDKRQVNEDFLCDCEKDRKMEENQGATPLPEK